MYEFIENNIQHIVGLIVLFLCALNIVVWLEVFKKEVEPDMRASFFNVGQGDSIFISARDGMQILIDGGPDNKVLSLLKNRMPYYDNSIDVVVFTHPHKDHISGLIDVLKRYDVETLIESGASYNTSEFSELEILIQKSGTRRIVLEKPAQLLFYNSARLKFLTPTVSFDNAVLKNVHDADIVSELDFEGRKILLMGDAEKKLEQQLIRERILGQVDILKVGHHGSKTSSIAEFLSVVRPRYSVISVGKNSYGHPTQAVLDRLAGIGSRILRTDIVGSVDVDIHNGALAVRQEK